MIKWCQENGVYFLTVLISSAILFRLYDNAHEFFYELFAYKRYEIFAGEYWRLLSGHFTHTLKLHFLLNFLAFIFISIYGGGCPVKWFIGSLLFCSLGTGLGLLWLVPNVEHYVGMSGVLHGLLVSMALFYLYLNQRDYLAWIVLLIIFVKITHEFFGGSATPIVELLNMKVIHEAHLLGALSGVVYSSLVWLGYTLSYKRRV